ncbi:aminotransferase class I/II-fold pyridoxal phosphate-dependent enzyme [Paenibacillus alkalitolerans]|uniref:aminotransferase class I/II-fold pyridoxal phosphate-dependent enzyme n=1 Tax=Paenibacillus alkalitolerans TaxID=2799335 RepID=UPI001F199F03|nr:8-amino-7-oxononanoate synthase [Paenibacillus alkalitolerans]
MRSLEKMIPANPKLQWMEDELKRLESEGRLRSLKNTELTADGCLVREGRRMLNLASNHYLGLPLAAPEAGAPHRSGAAASRLVVGNYPELSSFEEEFASFKGTESALVFGSGYAANVGVISSVADRDTVVFSDRLNHASIVDGIVLSRADYMRYKHRDLDHLETLLKREAAKDGSARRRRLIVTDSVFSMDGTTAPLKELVGLKERWGAILMVDEAHSGGVSGDEGQGLVHEQGLTERVDIIMGTFSKAYGSYGAYVAGAEVLKRYLVNHARSLIYSTALPPSVIAATRRNWMLAREEGWRRERLRTLTEAFRARLAASGFRLIEGDTPIVPLLVGGNESTVRFGEALQARGICAIAIRPPTVAEGTARIRFSLMAVHREGDLAEACDTIAEEGRRLGVI